MSRGVEARLAGLVSAWVRGVVGRPGITALAFLVGSVAALAYSATHLDILAEQERLFDQELAFRRAETRYHQAFPSNFDNLFVVVDADTPERAGSAAQALSDLLRRDHHHFQSVYQPGGGAFFERHAFLYLDTEELEELALRLAEAQPYLAALSRERSLRNLASLLARGSRAVREGDVAPSQLERVFDGFSDATEAVLEGREFQLSWTEALAQPRLGDRPTRRFLMIRPVIDPGEVIAGREAIRAVRRASSDLGLDEGSNVRVRITGDYALSVEEMDVVRSQAARAGLGSLLAVAAILLVAFRSLRLVVATIVSLLAGLSLTVGFTAVAIGHFNLISVAFAVLFIGLGVDFGIHFCIGYRERVGRLSHEAAMLDTSRDVGTSLVLCAATTCIGFFAFVPTDFVGVAELGLISGIGILVSLLCMLTLLPALISLFPLASARGVGALQGWETRLLKLPVRHPRLVRYGACGLAGAAALFLPQARFDNNPLNVRDPSSESVQTFAELLDSDSITPWNLNAIAADLDAAEHLARKLDALPQVDRVVTVTDYVPADQDEKLDIIDDIALFLEPPLRPAAAPEANAAADVEALTHLLEEVRHLRASEAAVGALAVGAQRFEGALVRFLDRLGPARAATLALLEESLLGTLPEQLRVLNVALEAGPVAVENLPIGLLERMISDDERIRVEIFPRDDIRDNAAMAAFVDAVRGLVPDVAGSANEIVESGRTVVRALRQALLSALVAVTLLVWLLWRRLTDAALVLIPLVLASTFTVASAVALDIPFNFADVIVLPLLLGIGVDSSIHLVHRARQTPGARRNLLGTSTARAVGFSALTTIASFGTLGFAGHRGLATLGQLLALGVAHTLLCTLVVLPALVLSRDGPSAKTSGEPGN